MADTRIKVILDLESDISKAKSSISQLNQAFSNIGGSKGNALTATLEQIEKEFTKLQNVSGSAMSKVGDFSKVENSTIKIDGAIKKLSKELVNMGTLSADQAQKMFPPTILAKINKVNSAIKIYNTEIKKSENNAIKQATREFEDQQKKVKELSNELQKYEQLKSSKKLVSQEDYNQAKSAQTVSRTAATKAQNKVASLQMQRQAAIDEYNNKTGKNTGAYSKGAKDLQVEIKAAQEEAKKLADNAKQAEEYFKTLEVKETLTSKIENTKKALEEASQKSQDLQNNLNNVKADSVAKAMDEAKKKLEGLTGVDLSKITNIEQLNQLFEKFSQEGIEGFKKGVLEATGSIQQLDSANKSMSRSTEESKSKVEEENRALSNVEGLKSRIQYFFSLTNTVQLARRAVRQAVETIKELDAAMTETAVVTDFNVGDMWEQLPRYTEAANNLGTTTLGAYQTMTLFYQQGLETNEVFEIGTETMKMARIAGLEYSDATNLMTAALRGFNMELNETSAQRVNDVYSELAAITAADTQEIATAMTKTASIAANANMEFETTAALLAQIIETTREPAETAGTAMKTIIARFTEMKKATSDIVSVDGEEVSVNKVEAALKSAGVALRDVNGEFRNLDDVFLELSSKWNSLDMMTQRYIATMAAGSRQQSRFIAMMSDYDRTLELVNAAYDSSGASQKQFEKTQESLESKINRLTNAWNEFLMGITNSSVIKGAVDLLTGILNIINKITGAFGDGVGGVLKFGVALATLKGGEVASRVLASKAIAFTEQAKKNPGDKSNTKFFFGGSPKEKATNGLNNFTERLNNFNEGKGFKLNVDLDTEEAQAELTALEGKAVETGATTASSMEVAQQQTNELGASAVTTGAEMSSIGAGAGQGATAAKPSLDLTEKEIEDIKQEAIEARIALKNMNPNADDAFIDNFLDEKGFKNADGDIIGLPSSNSIKETFGYKNKDEAVEALSKIKTQKNLDNKINQMSNAAYIADTMGDAADKVDDVGDALDTATPKAKGLGSALKGAGKAVLNFATAHPILLGVTAALAAATAAAIILWQNMDSQKAQREFEEARQTADNFKDALDRATDSLENLKKSWDSLGEQEKTLNGLVKGTLEWKEALAEYNAQVLEVVKNNKDLSFIVDENGKLVIQKEIDGKILTGEEAYEASKEEQYSQKNLLQLQTMLANSYRDYAETEAYKTTLKEAENLKNLYEEQMLNSTGQDGELGSAIGYLWYNKRTNEARTSLGLSENYTEEEYKNLQDKQISNFEKQNKAAIQSYLSNEYSDSIALAASELTANVNSTLSYRKSIEQEMGISDSTANDAIGYFDENKDTYLKEWAKLQGYDYKDGKIYNQEGKQIKIEWTGNGKAENDPDTWITNEQITSDLIQSKTAEKSKKASENVANILSNTGTDISELYAGQWEKVNEQVLNQISKDQGVSGLIAKQIAGDLSNINVKNLTSENQEMIDFIEATTGKTINELEGTVQEVIANNLQETAKNVQKTIENKREELKYNLEDFYTPGENTVKATEMVADYNETINKLSNEEVSFLSNLKTNIENSFNEVDSKALFRSIQDAYIEASKNGNQAILKDFRTVWSSVDWSSPLKSLKNLNNLIETGTNGVKELAKAAKNDLSNSLLGSANQFKEVVTSEDFSDVSNELTSIYEKEEKITFDNIQEAAEKSSTLNLALQDGTISATGFAKAMELVAQGTLDVTNVTSELLDALTQANQLMDNMDQAYKRAKDYNFGNTYTDIGKTYKEAAEAVQDLVAGGAWGDPQFDSYMEYIVGQKQWAEALAENNYDTKEAYNSLKSVVESSKGTMLGIWKNAINNQEGDSPVSLKNGLPVFDLTNIESTEDLINKVAKATGKTEDEARAMVADAAAYSSELSNALENLDKIAALKKLLVGKTAVDGKYTLTDAEMEALGISEEFLKRVKLNGEQGGIRRITNEEREQMVGAASSYAETEFKKVKIVNDSGRDLTGSQLKNNIGNISDESMSQLQSAFDKSVNNGIASGLTLDQAKQAAISGLADYVGAENAQKLGAALVAGYQDDNAAVAAAQASAQQAQLFYNAIYSAIVNAMADAYGIGIGVSGAITDNEDGTYTISGRKFKKENGKTYEIGDDGTSTVVDNFNIDTYANYQKAASDSATVAAERSQQLYSTSAILVANGSAENEEEANKMVDKYNEASVDSGTSGNAPDITIDQNPYVTTYVDAGETGVPGLDKEGGGDSSDEKFKKANYAEENANKQLEALDRVRQTNDREAELIEKLPEEIQFPLKMANLGEDMLYEYQEIQINKNKQAALQNQLDAERDQAKYYGEYYYYDEFTDAYMYDVEKMASDDLDDEKRQEIEEEISNLQEINDKLNAVEDELDGGKIQKVFRTLEKATDGASKALKKEAKAADLLEEEFGDLAKQLGLDDELKKFGDSIDNTIKSSKLLNKSFEGLGIVSEETLSKLDKLPIGDNTKNLIKNTLGKNEGGTIGSVMGDMFGASSDMFGSIGDILNFDMMSMGLDGMNMMKDMGQKMIQYVVQFVQTIINWWINREDWLYNLLSAIEQEVRNFNRQSEVEERFRLYSDEGLNDLVSAWEAMRASLEKQIDLNEQLIESRQAELQFLNMTNLPFAPAFYYDYAEERVIENPWVYDIYVLLLDLGSMIPEFGQIFSSIKQLMEDNKKRMEDAVQEIEDARDKILELEKQQLELRTKYMEDEIELEELVMDTIIEKQQEQIDELSTMNEAIEQGNEKLIQTLNDNLDRIRQQRENQDKEEELAEKERRLAYLRQDTSSANRAEIMNLQEELKDERRDYTDELIDQKISELEKQNELAAEQRQKQIDLLQSQLDYTEKYGLQWAEAQTLIKNGFDSEGRLRVGTDLYNMLMSKEDFTSMGLGSTRQTQQIMDWNVTSIAAAAFREINDIWEEGFGNFEMSNDVHDQSRLHLWEDRQVDYYQLPSWLSFLQPAANTIQDYLWRTGNNISAFVETGFLSGKNSSSILGKTVVPLLQGIYKAVVGRVDEYNSLNEAETGGFEEVSGAITQASDNLGYGLGEKLVNGISNAFASVGGDIVNGFTNSMSNYAVPKTQTQTTGNFNMNFYINSEDREEGMSIGESVLRAFREGISNLSIFG